MDDHCGIAIFDDAVKFIVAKAPVKRLNDKPDSGACKENFHVLDTIFREHRDAVAFDRMAAVDKTIGQPTDTIFERGKIDPTLVRNIHQRLASRRPQS